MPRTGPSRCEASKRYLVKRGLEILSAVLYSVQHDCWKLADFGISSEATSNTFRTTNFARGTPAYRAPEIIESNVYNKKSDIWALGVIFFELVFREVPFHTDFEVHRFATQNDVVQFPTFTNNPFDERRTKQLLLTMLEQFPEKRLSADDLIGLFSSLRRAQPQVEVVQDDEDFDPQERVEGTVRKGDLQSYK